MSSVARHLDFKIDQLNRNFSNFHHFLGVSTPKCLPSRTNELKVFGRLESTHFYERHVLGVIYHCIWQQSQMVFSHPLSGPMKLTSGSNQRYKRRGQKSPLYPTAHAGPFLSGYCLVNGSLKTSKRAKIMIQTSPSHGWNKYLEKPTTWGCLGDPSEHFHIAKSR